MAWGNCLRRPGDRRLYTLQMSAMLIMHSLAMEG